MCIVLICSGVSSAAKDAHNEPLTDLRAALRTIEEAPLILKATGEARSLSQETGEPEGSEEAVIKLSRTPDRCLVSIKKANRRPGTSPWLLQTDFITYDDASVLGLQTRLDESLEQLTQDGSDLQLTYWSERIAGSQDVDPRSAVYKLDQYSQAIWWIGRTPLSYYFGSEAQIKEATVVSGVLKLAADSPYGSISLEASFEEGWLPRKFKIIKQPDDLCVHGTIRELFEPPPDDANAVYPPGQEPVESNIPRLLRVEWDGVAEDFTLEADGRMLPRRITVVRRVMYRRGPPQVVTSTVTIESLRFNPQFTETDFQTDIEVPLNHPISVRGAEHLAYKWDGEKPVPGVPVQPPFAGIPLDDPNSMRRALLVALNVALIAAICVLLWWRRRAQT